jgi:hypothetical protein
MNVTASVHGSLLSSGITNTIFLLVLAAYVTIHHSGPQLSWTIHRHAPRMFIKVLLSAVIAADDKQGYQRHVSYVFLISDNQSFP